jgi:chromosome segregation ATPase
VTAALIEQQGLLVVQLLIGALSLLAIWIGARALKQREVVASMEKALTACRALAETRGEQIDDLRGELGLAHDRSLRQEEELNKYAAMVKELKLTDASAMISLMTTHEAAASQRWESLRDDLTIRIERMERALRKYDDAS